jgi:hypothetical protein
MNVDTSFEDEPDVEEGADVEEIILGLEDEFSDVRANAENGSLLDRIFEEARAKFEKDERWWNDFFEELSKELMATDDEDNQQEILRQYLNKAQKNN